MALWTHAAGLLFKGPILSTLIENDGCFPYEAVKRKLENHTFKGLLSERDLDPYKGAPSRPGWWTDCWWERDGMVKDKLLDAPDDSPEGSWKITDLGRRSLEEKRQALIKEGFLKPEAQWEFTDDGRKWWMSVRGNPRRNRWLRKYRMEHAPLRKPRSHAHDDESD